MRKLLFVCCVMTTVLCGCSVSERKVETSASEVIEPTSVNDAVETSEVETSVPIMGAEVEATEFVPEEYDIESELLEHNAVEIEAPYDTEMFEVDTEVGYSFISLREMEHDRSLEQYDNITTIQDILSGEYWSGDQVVHKHTVVESTQDSGYYYCDCRVEEYVDVQVYSADGLDKGWVYDEGETFADWLDQECLKLAWGEDSQIDKYNWTVGGKTWIVYCAQRNLSQSPKDCFSSVMVRGYKQEDNGDYVVVTLKHDNFPTIKTDDYVPSHEARKEAAITSMKAILSTIHRK